MGLPKIIQIPCHHVLANRNVLKFKKGAPLKQIFNINLGIGIIKKNYFFCLYFWHISLCFYPNFDWERSLDAELNYASNEYPLGILFTGSTATKMINTLKTWWWCHHHVFHVFLVFGVEWFAKSISSGYSLDADFNYIQQALPIEIWVKTQGNMSKIRTKK